jgi:hypothetical protein
MRPTTRATSSATTFIGCSKKLWMAAIAPAALGSVSGCQMASLPAASDTLQISPKPPGTLHHTMPTVAARPPNMMQNWITSFQITASMPPSIV